MAKPAPFEPRDDDGRLDTTTIDAQETSKGLEDLEDEDELMDDRFLEEYRRRRLEELRQEATCPRFGKLLSLTNGRSEFIDQVTNAGDGIWVVCHLYKESVAECRVLNQCLEELAAQYPYTKFVKMVSTDCIPGYPDDNLPTVLLYKSKKCVNNLVGLNAFGGLSTSPGKIADVLNSLAQEKVCKDDDSLRYG